jgi:hypothetical protein
VAHSSLLFGLSGVVADQAIALCHCERTDVLGYFQVVPSGLDIKSRLNPHSPERPAKSRIVKAP